jgi:hypothetical protein
MIDQVLFAAAGLAELSPEESRELEQKLLLVAGFPFLLYCVLMVVILAVLLRKPARRQKLKGKALLGLIILLATGGFLLLVPTLPFLPSLFW